MSERLAQLKERLRLPTLPRRIECCDISHLGGRDTVGAIVALTDGEPDKKRYRTFHVRGDGLDAKTTDAAPTPGGAGRAGSDEDGEVSSPATTTARCTRCSRAASAAG